MTDIHDIDITGILPQAAPFIMIDAVDAYVPGECLTTVKNVTGNEWPCADPSPLEQAYPEALLIEGAAQTAIVFSALNDPSTAGTRTVALGKITAEFHRPVRIGDRICFTTATFKVMRSRGFVDIRLTRGDDEIGSVSIFYSFMMGAGRDQKNVR